MKSKKASKTIISHNSTTCYQFDQRLGFWGIPNLDIEMSYDIPGSDISNKRLLIKHNKEGNRDEDLNLEKNEKTILCFGGSHTWGGGVDQNLRYSNRLSELSGRKVQNLGHCSMGIDQVCLAIMQNSVKLNPEIIVVEQYPWAVHRILNNYVNGYIRPYFYLDSNQNLKLKKVPVLARYKFFRQAIGVYYSFRKEFREFRLGIDIKNSYDPLHDPIFLLWKTRQYDSMYTLLDKILSVINDYCRKKNIKLLFALGAILQQFGEDSASDLVDYDLPRNRLIQLLNKNNIAYVDMTSHMLAKHSKEEPVIFSDGHINAKGHDLFARVVFESLMKKGWLLK
jgi:lysophospholipase L1-like esterase